MALERPNFFRGTCSHPDGPNRPPPRRKMRLENTRIRKSRFCFVFRTFFGLKKGVPAQKKKAADSQRPKVGNLKSNLPLSLATTLSFGTRPFNQPRLKRAGSEPIPPQFWAPLFAEASVPLPPENAMVVPAGCGGRPGRGPPQPLSCGMGAI